MRPAVFVTASAAALLLVMPMGATWVAVEPVWGVTARDASPQESLDDARARAWPTPWRRSRRPRPSEPISKGRSRSRRPRSFLCERAPTNCGHACVCGVPLYVFNSKARLQAFVNTGSVIDASRAVHFTETVGDHDQSVANDLQDTSRALQERTAQLRARHAELDDTIASLFRFAVRLDERIARGVTAYQQSRVALVGALSTYQRSAAPGHAPVCLPGGRDGVARLVEARHEVARNRFSAGNVTSESLATCGSSTTPGFVSSAWMSLARSPRYRPRKSARDPCGGTASSTSPQAAALRSLLASAWPALFRSSDARITFMSMVAQYTRPIVEPNPSGRCRFPCVRRDCSGAIELTSSVQGGGPWGTSEREVTQS